MLDAITCCRLDVVVPHCFCCCHSDPVPLSCVVLLVRRSTASLTRAWVSSVSASGIICNLTTSGPSPQRCVVLREHVWVGRGGKGGGGGTWSMVGGNEMFSCLFAQASEACNGGGAACPPFCDSSLTPRSLRCARRQKRSSGSGSGCSQRSRTGAAILASRAQVQPWLLGCLLAVSNSAQKCGCAAQQTTAGALCVAALVCTRK